MVDKVIVIPPITQDLTQRIPLILTEQWYTHLRYMAEEINRLRVEVEDLQTRVTTLEGGS